MMEVCSYCGEYGECALIETDDELILRICVDCQADMLNQINVNADDRRKMYKELGAEDLD